MKKLTKKQTLLILWLALCSAALIYLLTINIYSIIEASKHLGTYLNANEQSLIIDMTQESINALISQLTASIVKCSISIISTIAMYTTVAILLVKKIIKLGVKDRKYPPTA